MGKILKLRPDESDAPSVDASPPAPPNPPDPLACYIAPCVAGDPEATAALLRAVGPVLLRAARAVLGPSNSELEDAVQDSMVAFLRGLESFRSESSLAHFASRIAMRRATDYLRQGHSRGRLVGNLADIASTGHAEHGQDTARQLRHRHTLRAILDELSDVQVETLLMRVVFDYSIEEIARATQVPINTVRSRLLLAKKALRSRIEGSRELRAFLRGEMQ